MAYLRTNLIDKLANLPYYGPMASFDWSVIEDWFVTSSGNMGYRQVASESQNLACFGYQTCSYEMIREMAKQGLWMQKRAEFQAQQHGGIIGDYKQAYQIVTMTINEKYEELSPTELASLGSLQLKYGEAIMALNPPMRDSDVEILTKDDVLRITQDAIEELSDLSKVEPADLLSEETPIAQSVADERDN